MSEEIIIAAAKRTPIGNFNGYYANTPATALGTTVIKSILDETNITGDAIDAAYMGCVLPANLGQAPARQAAINAGLSIHTPCVTVNKVCGSGMQTIVYAHDAIKAGSQGCVIAGGLENMSCAPYMLAKARFGYRLGHAQMFDHMIRDGLEDAYEGKSMGIYAEQCANTFNFSRQAQDEFARRSVERAQHATANNYFQAEIAATTVTTRKGSTTYTEDEGPATAVIDNIAKLKPAFIKDGTVTAANASSISDGSAAVLVTNTAGAKKYNLTPLARIVGHHSFAHQPEWFTTAPVGAIQGLLKKIQWSVSDVDLWEINEAFAVVTMAAIHELKLSPDTVNVNGGACVLGHPIGASGTRIVVTLIHALKQRKLSRGIASLCIGGGEALALAIELV